MPTQVHTYDELLSAREKVLKKRVEPITHQLEIRWNPAAKKWVVSQPPAMVWRGLDSVEWTLIRDKDHPQVTVHFQFPDMKLFVDFGKQDRLSKDKTAKIGRRQDSLTLQVHSDACRRTNPHHYAVWIGDKDHPDGGEYAVGKDLNPPPEITVGP